MNPYAATSVTARPDRSYLATRVLTAPPQALVLMLYDGALRETARARSIDPSQPGGREQLHKALTRAQDFIRELLLALDREKGGELADRLAALYLFCQERLIQANVKADPSLCEDVLRVLRPLRDAWAQICGAGAGEAAAPHGGGPEQSTAAQGTPAPGGGPVQGAPAPGGPAVGGR
ncbi:MAG: flagellar export chaperone FliS [Bacillota bacterium]|nr:MAG: flagellar export chaperone FliS [Bacillota bacterium]